MASSTPAVVQPQLVIPDRPAEKDEFGPHTRIARALFTLITGPPVSGRCIALTGPWGSGKSTVILQLEKIIAAEVSSQDSRPEVFLFDAWTHQGDPLRRCFLERLIQFARPFVIENPATPESKATSGATSWTKRLNTITGRREKTKAIAERPLSSLATFLAIALLICFPVGGSFLGKVNIAGEFWRDKYAWIALALYAIPISLAIYASFRGGLGKLASVVIRDLHQDTATTTVRTREASSIDFQKLFSKIARGILAKPHRRLVIVIDNLDRVDAADAIGMWTTMRTFFEFGEEEWNQRVWLIVPFDRSALRKLWKTETKPNEKAEAHSDASHDRNNDRAGEELLDSFLNKTFQMVFHLAPPLLTGLRKYFQDQMKVVFDVAAVNEHFENVYRLFSLLGPASPSPRQVKSFLNKLRAQWLIWSAVEAKKQVPLPFLAVQALRIDKLSEDPDILIREDFLDAAVINVLNQCLPTSEDAIRDWRQLLAAAHFNVDPEAALQSILFGRFSTAFQSGDFTILGPVRREAYFPIVLKAYADDQHDEWRGTPLRLTNAILFLAESAGDFPRADARDLWQNLLSDAAEVASWGPLDSRRIQAVGAAIRNGLPAASVRDALARRVIEAAGARDINTPIASWLGTLDESVRMLHDCGGSAVVNTSPIFVHDPGFFVNAYLQLVRTMPASPLPGFLRTSQPDAVPAAFATSVATLGDDPGLFLSLRKSLVDASASTYAALNQAVLRSAGMVMETKLAFLLQGSVPSDAELTAADLVSIVSTTVFKNLSADEIAAIVVLAPADEVTEKWESVRVAEKLPFLQIQSVAQYLLSWKRIGSILNPAWWGPAEYLTPRLLMWIVENDRAAELPLGPLARMFPLISSLSETSDALLQTFAARIDLLEILR